MATTKWTGRQFIQRRLAVAQVDARAFLDCNNIYAFIASYFFEQIIASSPIYGPMWAMAKAAGPEYADQLRPFLEPVATAMVAKASKAAGVDAPLCALTAYIKSIVDVLPMSKQEEINNGMAASDLLLIPGMPEITKVAIQRVIQMMPHIAVFPRILWQWLILAGGSQLPAEWMEWAGAAGIFDVNGSQIVYEQSSQYRSWFYKNMAPLAGTAPDSAPLFWRDATIRFLSDYPAWFTAGPDNPNSYPMPGWLYELSDLLMKIDDDPQDQGNVAGIITSTQATTPGALMPLATAYYSWLAGTPVSAAEIPDPNWDVAFTIFLSAFLDPIEPN